MSLGKCIFSKNISLEISAKNLTKPGPEFLTTAPVVLQSTMSARCNLPCTKMLSGSCFFKPPSCALFEILLAQNLAQNALAIFEFFGEFLSASERFGASLVASVAFWSVWYPFGILQDMSGLYRAFLTALEQFSVFWNVFEHFF